ncbi:HD domain-containing protein [Streptomyces sp. NPDC020731]|uniref:HD domain-containing protein n=1 Tax=Streptomyces sp. NPDC020731 TaxID=3365085 RepID=UPI0037BB0A0A
MSSLHLHQVLTALGCTTWDTDARARARIAGDLALTTYRGHTRDQGTPYLEHPLAVVTILRKEIRVTHPETLLLALLHDALEIAPNAQEELTRRLGAPFTARLRALTADHRLERRAKADGDETRWRAKQEALPPEDLLVRLADRLHNLRDLAASPNTGRRDRFLRTLEDFHLPLAAAARDLNPHLAAMNALLHAEYARSQQEAHRETGRPLDGTDRPDRRPGLPPDAPRGHR